MTGAAGARGPATATRIAPVRGVGRAAAVALALLVAATGCGARASAEPAAAAAAAAPIDLRFRARGLAHGDELRGTFVAERRAADGSFAPVRDAAVRTVPGGADLGVRGAPGAWRVGVVWTSIHVEFAAEREVDGAAPVDFDLGAAAIRTPIGEPVWVRGVVRRAGEPVLGARVELEGVGPALAGVPPVVTVTDAGGRFAIGPATVAEVRVRVAHALGSAEVRGPVAERFEISLR